MSYTRHLRTPNDLVTTYEEIRAGFVALALERTRRATPYVEEARSLQVLADQASSPADLLRLEGIRPALVTAAGLSDKAIRHLQDEDKEEAIQGLLSTYLEPAGSAFVEELVFRFLLTRGDSLGGSMRNIGGVLGQRKLTRAIIANLGVGNIPFHWLHGDDGVWIEGCKDDPDIELFAKGLSWATQEPRTIIYNLFAPFVKANIDICLLRCSREDWASVYSEPAGYVALGELKGGIDPAGADEHWKTARSALERIRAAFARHQLNPHTFFIGAAIATKMAGEIWDDLKSGKLSNAANLTGPKQLASLCLWLGGL